MSLRWKVALMLAATAIVVSLTVGVATYRVTSSRLMIEVDRSLVAFDPSYLGRQVPAGAPDPFRGFDLQQIGPDGRVFASSLMTYAPVSQAGLTLIGRPGHELFETMTTATGSARVRTIGVRDGALQVLRALDENERVLASLRTRILVSALLVSLAATVLGWLFADRVTASLRRLTTAARDVEATGRFDRMPAFNDTVPTNDEVGQLQTAFAGMLDALGRSQDAQHRLVQDAGHELRTPLTSLRTNVDTLAKYQRLTDDERDEIIADLRAETAELTNLVNELIAVGSGDLAAEPWTSFDLATVVNDLAARYQRRYGRPFDVSANPSPVFGQRSAVQRAVSCLLDNARKFDSTGGPITVVVDGSTVTVADRGIGVDAADSSMIFDRFHRAEMARTLPGSGLGLSIVRDVAVTHGGSAGVEARPGGGSVFTLALGSVDESRRD